ncbi:MAG: hypothetical protein ABII76_21785 [Pseudomonadota bacterium]
MNAATSSAPADPVLTIVQNLHDAKRAHEAAASPSKQWATVRDVYGDLLDDLAYAPTAQTLQGATAVLELAIAEAKFLDPMYGALMRSALGFLCKFEPPAPRPATRAELEAYNEWLHMERRLLAAELYPELGYDAERFVPCGTGANELHLPHGVNWKEMPSPSARAIPVLTAVGANFERIRDNSYRFLADTEAACIAGTKAIIQAEGGAQ